jgi:HPt (histidine-containing phosphotransfer) domain-containing protein
MLSNVATQLESLAAAAEHDDPDSAARAGHTLKGLASQFGAIRLARAGQRLQHGALDTAALAASLPRLQETADATREAVEAWLESHLEPSP